MRGRPILDNRVYASWLAKRPLGVRKLLEEYPLGTTVAVADGAAWFVIGATDEDHLIVAPDVAASFDEAKAARKYICADPLRRGEVRFEAVR